MAYATLEALKRYLRFPDPGTPDPDEDPELERALDVATTEIDHICSTTFEEITAAQTRVFLPYRSNADRYGRWRVPIDHLAADPVGVYLWNDTDQDYTTPATYTLYPIVPGPLGYTEILLGTDTTYNGSWYGWGEAESSSDYVAVEAQWGWDPIPAAVELACLIQAARIVKRRDSPFGMISTLDGSEMTRLTRTMDPDVVVALRGYIKYWAAR